MCWLQGSQFSSASWPGIPRNRVWDKDLRLGSCFGCMIPGSEEQDKRSEVSKDVKQFQDVLKSWLSLQVTGARCCCISWHNFVQYVSEASVWGTIEKGLSIFSYSSLVKGGLSCIYFLPMQVLPFPPDNARAGCEKCEAWGWGNETYTKSFKDLYFWLA